MDPSTTPSETPNPVDNTVATDPSDAQASETAQPGLSESSVPAKKRFGKIKLIPVIAIAAAVLIGGSAAGYFGLIAPNQPDTIWKTALDNTARGYDKLIAYGQEQKDTKGGTVKGTFKVENAEFVSDGAIDGTFDEKNSNINIDAGAAGTRLKFNVMTNIPEGATTPDMYLKAEGLDGLANLLGTNDPAAAETLASLDNQYYFIDHTLLEQFQKQLTSSTETLAVTEITIDDAVDFMKQLGEINREYVFTTDQQKAIFSVKEEVGKETVDGREVYHFKVALNKENVKDWNQAVCDRLVNHKVMKSLTGIANDEERKKDCEDTSTYESIDENQTADVWVDMKTKLIRTVRITEKEGASTVDFGLLYNGGNEYPFYLTFNDKEQGDVNLKVTLNTDTAVVNIAVDAAIKSEGNTGNVDVDLAFSPSTETVKFTKPEGAKSLSDLLAPFLNMMNPAVLEQTPSATDPSINVE